MLELIGIAAYLALCAAVRHWAIRRGLWEIEA